MAASADLFWSGAAAHRPVCRQSLPRDVAASRADSASPLAIGGESFGAIAADLSALPGVASTSHGSRKLPKPGVAPIHRHGHGQHRTPPRSEPVRAVAGHSANIWSTCPSRSNAVGRSGCTGCTATPDLLQIQPRRASAAADKTNLPSFAGGVVGPMSPHCFDPAREAKPSLVPGSGGALLGGSGFGFVGGAGCGVARTRCTAVGASAGGFAGVAAPLEEALAGCEADAPPQGCLDAHFDEYELRVVAGCAAGGSSPSMPRMVPLRPVLPQDDCGRHLPPDVRQQRLHQQLHSLAVGDVGDGDCPAFDAKFEFTLSFAEDWQDELQRFVLERVTALQDDGGQGDEILVEGLVREHLSVKDAGGIVLNLQSGLDLQIERDRFPLHVLYANTHSEAQQQHHHFSAFSMAPSGLAPAAAALRAAGAAPGAEGLPFEEHFSDSVPPGEMEEDLLHDAFCCPGESIRDCGRILEELKCKEFAEADDLVACTAAERSSDQHGQLLTHSRLLMLPD